MLRLESLSCNLVPIVPNKPIYVREDNPNVLVKAFRNRKTMEEECRMQRIAQALVPCPKILDTVYEQGMGYVCMDRIRGETIYDKYGEWDIPSKVWVQIHSIVSILFRHNLHYVDITPFNFMVEEGSEQVYVIDFGHCYESRVNWFLKEFLDGENAWNPDFA
jgi:tRNA A-37 threonylcarbamoyl transferase component Bud32